MKIKCLRGGVGACLSLFLLAASGLSGVAQSGGQESRPAAAATATAPTAAARVVAFVGVNVVPMDRERVLENQTVVVRDGRIAEIGPEKQVKVPEGALRVEGRGKYLLPGLADMHVHLPPGDGTKDDAASQHMRLFLANGVTTIRGMIGQPSNLTLRERVAKGELLGPTIFAAGPPVHGKSAPTPEAAEKLVMEQKQAGYDLLKVHEGLSPETYDAVVRTARRAGLPWAGHVTATVGLERALAASQSSIEHLDGYLQALVAKDSPVPPPPSQVVLGEVLKHIDEKKLPAIAEATRKAGVWNTPTLTLFKIVVSYDKPEDYLKWPEMQYVPPGLRSHFAAQKAGTANIPAPAAERQRFVELRNRVVKALHTAGAKLLVGPDSPQLFLVPGFATHRELQSFVEAGLTPYAAIEAATRNPAEYLKKLDEFGTVEVGKRADLLLVEADPLQSVANLQRRAGVMVRGRWLPETELRRMLAEVAALHRAPPQ
jgi:imidazolonepropionase-like amidohydrolase